MAGHNLQELYQSMFPSVVCTKTLILHQSGVARFLVETEGTGILNEMQAKFHICFQLDNINWVPLQSQDIFEAAWKLLSHRNFQKMALARPTASDLRSAFNGASDKGNILRELSYALSSHRSTPRCLRTLLEDMWAADVAHVKVIAATTTDLNRADLALKMKVSLRQVEETMEQKGLAAMSEFHQQCVQVIKRKHAVEIRVEGDALTVSGFKGFVAEALPDLRLLLRRVSSQRGETDILSNVCWVRQGPDGAAMTSYEPDVTVFLENTWRMKQKDVAILLDGQPRIVDLVKMQEYDVASGKYVTVTRTVISDSDVDVEACLQMTPEEECSLLSNMPEVSTMDENSEEFQEVVTDFYDSIKEYHSKIRIVKVEKLGNRLLYNQYKLKKASLYQRGVRNEVERTLYHGTSESSVKDIYHHGFNRSFCGKNDTAYGQGVYFAVNSALSVADRYSPPNADGHKFVFVAKVSTGDFALGCRNMRAAPLKQSADIPLRYDSVTDHLSRPTMFVIFNDTQAYPEYLITCQNIPRVS